MRFDQNEALALAPLTVVLRYAYKDGALTNAVMIVPDGWIDESKKVLNVVQQRPIDVDELTTITTFESEDITVLAPHMDLISAAIDNLEDYDPYSDLDEFAIPAESADMGVFEATETSAIEEESRNLNEEK